MSLRRILNQGKRRSKSNGINRKQFVQTRNTHATSWFSISLMFNMYDKNSCKLIEIRKIILNPKKAECMLSVGDAL